MLKSNNIRRNFILPVKLNVNLNKFVKKLERYFNNFDLQIAKERSEKFEKAEHKGLTSKELKEKLCLQIHE